MVFFSFILDEEFRMDLKKKENLSWALGTVVRKYRESTIYIYSQLISAYFFRTIYTSDFVLFPLYVFQNRYEDFVWHHLFLCFYLVVKFFSVLWYFSSEFQMTYKFIKLPTSLQVKVVMFLNSVFCLVLSTFYLSHIFVK